MRTYEVKLRVVVEDTDPNDWDWATLLDLPNKEHVELVECIVIDE